MELLKRVLTMAAAALLLCAAAHIASAATYSITYTLAGAGKVSMNIYDSNGKIVRELLHVVQQSAGSNTVVWDGLDNWGNSVASGNYTWKLLRTPSGLTAQFLTNVGANYTLPGQLHPPFESLPPGNHGGVQALAVDSTGLYEVSAGSENVPCLIKQSQDGSIVQWGVDGSESDYSVASDGTTVYSLAGGQMIERDALTGCSFWGGPNSMPIGIGFATPFAESYNGSWPSLVAVNGTTLVLIYSTQNEVQWIDETSGAVIDSAPIAAPQSVAIDNSGTVYMVSGTSIVTMSSSNHMPVNLITGLNTPTLVDVDKSNGDILVFCAGTQQQVLRYNSTGGVPKNIYGQLGGRVDGLYTTTAVPPAVSMQQSFLNLSDMKSDNAGGFFIAEPTSAPRRVSHFNSSGSLIKEWYGGQQWEPWVSPEPNDPTEVWMESQWGYVMRCKVDYTANTCTVQSTYKIEGLGTVVPGDGGLVHEQQNGMMWKAVTVSGTTYLVLEESGDGLIGIMRYDPTGNTALVPVAWGSNCMSHAISYGIPQSIQTWAVNEGFNPQTCAYLWTDADGDGHPSQGEVKFFANGGPYVYDEMVDTNLNIYYLDGASIGEFAVSGINSAGAPLYPTFPNAAIAANLPTTRPWGWYRSPYFFHDTATGNLYAATNSLELNWGHVTDAYMIKYNPNGSEAWESGTGGGDHAGNPPGKIGEFRSIAGTANGCIAAFDFTGDGSLGSSLGMQGSPPTTYVWDPDGLFVGGLFDNLDLVHARFENYRLSSEMIVSELNTDTSGNVRLFSSAENQSSIFAITGWNNWEHQNGAITVTTPSTASTGQGLQGTYYSSANFTSPVSTRVDPTVNFNWGTAAPSGSGLPNGSNYSVRWIGKINLQYGPTYVDAGIGSQTGSYKGTNHECGDTGSSITVGFHGTSFQWGAMTGTYYGTADVYVDGVLQSPGANLNSPSFASQIVYSKAGLANTDHTIEFVNNGSGRIDLDYWVLDGGVTEDDSGEQYTFYTKVADGARLWIDDRLVVNDPTDKNPAVETSGELALTSGIHNIRLDYYDDADPSTVALSWSTPDLTKQVIPSAYLYPSSDYVQPLDVNTAVPGVIQCENYDEGGDGVGYHHVVPVGTFQYAPFPYRTDLDTMWTQNINFWWPYDLVVSYHQAGNFSVQDVAGEWMKYTITAAQTGTYTAYVNVTPGVIDTMFWSQVSGGLFHLEMDGTMVGSEMKVPPGTGAAPFTLQSTGPFTLSAGKHAMRLVFDTNPAAMIYPSLGSFDYIQLTMAAAAPTFSPAAGTFTGSTSVTISSTTPSASFVYTTDGSTPTESNGTVTHGTLYTGPVTIAATSTLKTIAFASNYSASTVTSGVYTIKAATPTFSPAAGTYTTSTSETISSTTTGASFAYTTDGTTPTESGGTVTHGTLYTAAVNITATTTLKAIAFKVGITDSAVASGTFTIKAATPTYSPAAGTFTSSASVTISSTTPGVSFAYTTDGTTPTESGGTVTHGTLYSGAVSITATSTLKAIAFKVGITDSAAASGVYTIKAATPTFGTAAGVYVSPATTTLATATSGASIAYTTDGTTPTESGGTVIHGTLYSGAITLAAGLTTVKAIAFKVGDTDSAVASAAYTVFSTVGVGSPPVAGSASASGGVLTVNGSGGSDSGPTDQLQICYLPMTANCTLIARMTGLTGSGFSEAGLAIRGDLTATGATEAMTVTPGTTTYFIHRNTSGGSGLYNTGPSISPSADEYFKLVRSGSTVTIYASTTTSSWGTAVGTATITFGSTVYLGFEVLSGENSLSTATWDNIAVTSP